MDIGVLQKDFYNRYGVSKNRLFNTKCGMLYTLLGFCDIYGALSLNCVMAPYITSLGRILDGKDIVVLNTDKVNKTHLTHNDFSDLELKRGAQILYDNKIPPFFNSSPSYKMCIRKLLMKINNQNDDNILSIANCAEDDNISPYIALLKTKGGYCIKITRSDYEIVPLPLNEYKIVLAYSDEILPNNNYDKISDTALKLLRTSLLHIKDLSMLTFNDVEKISKEQNNIKALNFLRFVAEENDRIKSVAENLKKCNVDVLFDEMKNSCESMNILLGLNSHHEILYSILSDTSEVCAFRFFNNSMLFIAENENVDLAINEINERFYTSCGIKLNFIVTGNV